MRLKKHSKMPVRVSYVARLLTPILEERLLPYVRRKFGVRVSDGRVVTYPLPEPPADGRPTSKLLCSDFLGAAHSERVARR